MQKQEPEELRTAVEANPDHFVNADKEAAFAMMHPSIADEADFDSFSD